jgi:hypothetical protein
MSADTIPGRGPRMIGPSDNDSHVDISRFSRCCEVGRRQLALLIAASPSSPVAAMRHNRGDFSIASIAPFETNSSTYGDVTTQSLVSAPAETRRFRTFPSAAPSGSAAVFHARSTKAAAPNASLFRVVSLLSKATLARRDNFHVQKDFAGNANERRSLCRAGR